MNDRRVQYVCTLALLNQLNLIEQISLHTEIVYKPITRAVLFYKLILSSISLFCFVSFSTVQQTEKDSST